MSIIPLTKKSLLAVFAGLFVFFIVTIVVNIISFSVNFHISRSSQISEIESLYSQKPYILYIFILRIFSFLTPILGGIAVGWIVKDKGWLYGGILGIVLSLISLSIAMIVLFLPTSLMYGSDLPADFRKDENLQGILNIIIYSPITILKTAFGGYLGELLRERNRNKK